MNAPKSIDTQDYQLNGPHGIVRRERWQDVQGHWHDECRFTRKFPCNCQECIRYARSFGEGDELPHSSETSADEKVKKRPQSLRKRTQSSEVRRGTSGGQSRESSQTRQPGLARAGSGLSGVVTSEDTGYEPSDSGSDFTSNREAKEKKKAARSGGPTGLSLLPPGGAHRALPVPSLGEARKERSPSPAPMRWPLEDEPFLAYVSDQEAPADSSAPGSTSGKGKAKLRWAEEGPYLHDSDTQMGGVED